MAVEQTEIFIALVAAVGIDVAMVAEELETELGEYGYTCQPLRLSDYLADVDEADDFRAMPHDERLWNAMDAGDRLREGWGREDALALWAVSDIVASRTDLSEDLGDERVPANLRRHAFILRSLKTRDELDTLRGVYGDRLFVVAAYSPDEKRLEQLRGEIRASRRENDPALWIYQPEELIARDMDEQKEGGQNVADTFHRADYFVRAWDRQVLRADVARTLEILFGHPYRTPTKDEYCQFMAAGASRRSAELGRQVGAAIATVEGSILALGCNEVPKFGGGAHWEEDGLGNREFEACGIETNRKHQDEIAAALADALSEPVHAALVHQGIDDEARRMAIAVELRSEMPARLLSGGLKDITEFGRAVHAEMDAVLDAVRRGVPIAGCTVYTTTYPCHNCVRHLVGAGIKRVVFVEPYPKSKARNLHEDSIASGPSMISERVVFDPFVGVAPRRYLTAFDAMARETIAGQPRKTEDSTVREFVKREAVPHFSDLEPAKLRPLLPGYRHKELIALHHFERLSGRDAGDEPAGGSTAIGDGPTAVPPDHEPTD